MVLCKFYLQGNCRFGDNCKFEHQVRDFNAAVSTSILRQNQQLPQPQQQQQQNGDLSVAIRSVANDMLLAEKGGQWLLSCYAPFKSKPPFPGFKDISFEEMRYSFFVAQNNGTIDQYKQQLQAVLHETVMRVRALQNPTPEILNIIKNLFNAPNTDDVNFTGPGKSILQQKTNAPAPTSSIFAQANQALFGQQTNAFNNNTTQQQPSNSVFSQQWTGNTFPQPPSTVFPQQPITQSTIFQQPQQPVTQSNVFQLPPPITQPNIFQQPQQPVTQSDVFHLPQPIAQSTIFQQSQQPVTHASVFQSPQSTVFQQQPVTQSTIFQPQQQSTQSIFGGNTTQTVINLNKPKDTDDSLYSQKEDLTETEIKAFEANLFEFGKIPEKPPTKDMCF